MKKFLFAFFALLSFLNLCSTVYAHEAYVLTADTFQKGLLHVTKNPFAPLFDNSHIKIFIIIFCAVAMSYLLIILWSRTSLSKKLDEKVRKLNFFGPLIIRLAISASLFYGAQINAIWGPELSLSSVSGGFVIRFALFAVSLLILSGLFTEFAGLVLFLIFIYVSLFFKLYMITYANYFGEIIVLMLFGSRFLSLDKLLFGKSLWIKKLEKYAYLEIPIVRVLYGIALMYAGYTIKFVHQGLTIDVYNQYHLNDFFHSTAAFIAAGAGLSEITIGFFIFIGFIMRFTIIISLVFITLSILYFREMLWPHLMLYGISISLLINSADRFTMDHYLRFWLSPIFKKFLKASGN